MIVHIPLLHSAMQLNLSLLHFLLYYLVEDGKMKLFAKSFRRSFSIIHRFANSAFYTKSSKTLVTFF